MVSIPALADFTEMVASCGPVSWGRVQSYHKHISGPLMDRMAHCVRITIAIHLEVMRVPFEKLSSLDGGEPSATIRARMEAVQAERFDPLGKPHVLVNSDMGPARRFRAAAD